MPVIVPLAVTKANAVPLACTELTVKCVASGIVLTKYVVPETILPNVVPLKTIGRPVIKFAVVPDTVPYADPVNEPVNAYCTWVNVGVPVTVNVPLNPAGVTPATTIVCPAKNGIAG